MKDSLQTIHKSPHLLEATGTQHSNLLLQQHQDSTGMHNQSNSISSQPVVSLLPYSGPQPYINLFQGHELQVVHEEARPINDTKPDWLFVFLIFIVGVITYLRVFYRKYFSQMISAFFNTNLTAQIVRDESLLVQRGSVMMSVVFNFVGALLMYLVSIHYSWSMGGMGTGFIRFLFFAIVVSGVYAVKFITLRLCGWLFDQNKEMSLYIFNIFLINNLLGLVLIPVIALLAFSEFINPGTLIIFSIVIISAAYLYRLGRGFYIAFSLPRYSPVYLFLYLCALEIAPLFVLIKVISQQ